jgi:aminomethyltransferase
MTVLPTPFHVRMAEHNRDNLWTTRGRFTVPAAFGSTAREALAARASALLADITPFSRLRLRGDGASGLLSRACGIDLLTLASGRATPVTWTTDGGGVRGAGMLARFAESEFLLCSSRSDVPWFAMSAARFGAELHDITMTTGMLLLAGPMAVSVLESAGLRDAARLAPLQQRVYRWRDLIVTVSRWWALGGSFEIACANEDALILFDRLYAAGRDLGLTLAGQEALDLLFLESGVLQPGVDFEPAQDLVSAEPASSALGLPGVSASARVLTGLEWDSTKPLPQGPLFPNSAERDRYKSEFLFRSEHGVGRVLRSAYSPALQRGIALGVVEPSQARPGTELIVHRTVPGGLQEATVRVVPLPFFK